MKNIYIPLSFYPTTILIIDDSKEMLASLEIAIKRHYPCKLFGNPEEALDFSSSKQGNSFLDRVIRINHEISGIDDSLIHHEAFNSERYQDIGAVVADYIMPAMSGVEFLSKLPAGDMGRILLTGIDDEQVAIEAFNQRLIDAYVKKTESGMLSTLLSKLHTLHWERFLSLSERVAMSIAMKGHNALSLCFSDSIFAGWLKNFLREKEIQEFYFVSSPANFLLIKSDGQHSWLVIKDTQSMDETMDLAMDQHDDNPDPQSQKLLEDIKSKKKVPFFYSDKDYRTPFTDWGPYIHNCLNVTGELDSYFVSHIVGEEPYVLRGDIKSSFKSLLPFGGGPV